MLALDGDQVLDLADLQPHSADQLRRLRTGEPAALDIRFVIGIPELVDPSDSHLGPFGTFLPRGQMHEAHRLDGLPEVTRRFGRNVLAYVRDLEELGLADRVARLVGHLAGQRGVPPREGDDGLEHDDDGFEQVPLAQGVTAGPVFQRAFALHLRHLGLGQVDDVVEAVPQHVAGQHDDPASHGAVPLE